MKISDFQKFIEETFGQKDAKRGIEGTFMWLIEEVGELSEALRGKASHEAISFEFADVFAWLATLANISNVNLEEAIQKKYGMGCPTCHRIPCQCSSEEKP